MSDTPKQTFVMAHDTARGRAIAAINNAPDGYVVTISPPSKSRDQEEYYHRIFGEAAEKCTHLGQKFDEETWKRLLVDQFRSDMLRDPQCPQVVRDNLTGSAKMVPSLDGTGIVQCGLQTRKFRKATASLFIEWLNAFMAERADAENCA